MVVVNPLPQRNNASKKKKIFIAASVLLSMYLCWVFFPSQQQSETNLRVNQKTANQPLPNSIVSNEGGGKDIDASCKYKSFADLSEQERMPSVLDGRHMVIPPQGGKVSLVCCETTTGPLSIVAHEKWAPLGTERFLDMVKSGFFDSGVPFMRCIKGWICQFGLNADKDKNDAYDTIRDDPPWLPQGDKFRQNEEGVKRFAQGYLAYAGAGKDSRDIQLIMALKADGPLAGEEPWEVPWGELVGEESYETLGKINTEYGEDGPPQGRFYEEGMSKEMRAEWPNLDYINSCRLLDEMN